MPRFTAERGDGTFVDAEGVTIQFHVWNAGEPEGVVQIAHGVGEYAARYEELAQALVAAGFAVYAADNRGHGRTGVGQYGDDLGRFGRPGPGGMRAAMRSVRRMGQLARAAHPGLPLTLLGHSLGSLYAQVLLGEATAPWDAAVLSATAYRTLRHMNGGDLNKRFAHEGGTGYEWLSRDPGAVAAAVADPLMLEAKVLQLFGLRDTMRLLGTPRRLDRDIPLLMILGGDDSLGGPASVGLLADAYRRTGLTDVEVRVYDGARHELFHETNRAEVTADLVAWLRSHPRPRLAVG